MINEISKYINKSEIDIFNTIGEYAKEKGYDALYFTQQALKSSISNDIDFNFSYKDISDYLSRKMNEEKSYGTVHYIHLLKEGKQVLSIYYDDADMRGVMFAPYYELYDFCSSPSRFIVGEEQELFKFSKIYIKQKTLD